jgi:two-component system, cell cycle response regulator
VKVLVVDDEPVSRMVLAAAVERLGYTCIVAEGGEAGWTAFRAEVPEVVVTDRVMDDLDGLALCRRIREDDSTPYTYLVLATGLDSRRDVLEGMSAGADDYLVKPVDPFELRVRLLVAERVTALHRRLETADRALRRANAELARLAGTDGLTGIGNRRRLEDELTALHARAVRAARPYALALLDIDHFKGYNDALGHQAGDEALRAVAEAIAAACRVGDDVYRYGGEELLVLLHEASLPGAATLAERLREVVEQLAIPHPASPHGIVTVSLGVADCRGSEHPAEVVAAADRALYEAKAAGRNAVRPSRPAGG